MIQNTIKYEHDIAYCIRMSFSHFRDFEGKITFNVHVAFYNP